MTICRSRIAVLLLALLAVPAFSPPPAYAVDRVLILAASDSAIDIERDLHCVPLVYANADTTATLAVAAANTAKLQAAFDAAAEIGNGSTHYVFVVPNKTFAIGTTTLNILSGVCLIGSGGLRVFEAEDNRLGATAKPNTFVNGPTLMRVTPSTNPIIKLTGYGNTIGPGLALWGAMWEGNRFRNSEVEFSDYPYFAGVGIECRNISQVSGHHTIECGFAFCTKCISFTFTGTENQTDVCNMPRIEAYECPNLVTINNEQSIQHHFGQVYYQTPSMYTAAATPSASCSIFDCVNGGGFSVDSLNMAGTVATTTGEFIIIRGGIMQTNNCAVTIGSLFCDATIFNKGRKFRLVKMVDTTARDLFLTVNGGEFAFGNAVDFTDPIVTHPLGLGEQWYNSDSSNIILNSDEPHPANLNIKLRIFGLSTADAAAYD